MLLGFIFSVLSATFSLSSTTTVDVSGEVPIGASHEYARSATTGQKGQMTAGNSTCLSLIGWDGCTIRSVALQMRSNKSSGKGSLSVRVGNDVIWSIANEEFASSAWAGEYTTEWVNIQKDVECVVSSGNTIEIVISATVNSLYIDSYTIEYEAAQAQCYSVEFKTGLDISPSTLTQLTLGSPIVLPEWQDTAIWRFIGWSEIEALDASSQPIVFPAGASYIPKKNTTLWAIYSDADESRSTTNYQSGAYIITEQNAFSDMVLGPEYGMAIHSGVFQGTVPVRTVRMEHTQQGDYILLSPMTEDMFYDVQFVSDTTLSIRNVAMDMYIGYNRNELADQQSLWQYRVLEDGSIVCYYFYKRNTYALYFGAGVRGEKEYIVAYSQPLDIESWQSNALIFFPAMIASYTSWPFGKWDHVKNIQSQTEEAIYRFGLYELHVKNGKKTLRLLHM